MTRTKTVLVVAALAVAALLLSSSLPELRRYLRIRRM